MNAAIQKEQPINPFTGKQMTDFDWETPIGEVIEVGKEMYQEFAEYNRKMAERMNKGVWKTSK